MNKLAIGITTYNNDDNIANIKKIYNMNEVDVYIVDDSSTDDTQQLLSAENIPFSVPPRKIGAPGYARNMIIDLATANGNQFITFIDGDDDAIIENLKYIAGSLEPKYGMYCTPILIPGYNQAYVPLGSSNYEYTGSITKAELLKAENQKLKFRLLLASGGRIYNLKVINDNNLRYDPDKSGQDGLFNHGYLDVIDEIYFSDTTKPYYLYDIQMGSLSNNYRLDILKKRLLLIEQIAKFPYAIHTKEEFADKTFARYTDTFLATEEEKVEVAKILSEFAGTELSYMTTKDYLNPAQSIPDFSYGLNIVVINSDLYIENSDKFNIIKIDSFDQFTDIKEQLMYDKTVVFDNSFLQVNTAYLESIIGSDEDVIQPYLQTENLVNAHLFRNVKYHGFSSDGFASTYSFTGMIFKTKYLFTYDFNYSSSYEYLIKVLFFNMIIPVIHYADGFFVKPRICTSSYRRNVIKMYSKCYFANTRAKISIYSRLAKEPIKKGAFHGAEPSYLSQNVSHEDLSFVETELQEFHGFDGAYFIDEDNNIIETTSQASELNFSKMFVGKKIEGGTSKIGDKKLINIPCNCEIKAMKNLKLKDYTVIFDDLKPNAVSVSYLKFEHDVIAVNANERIHLIDQNSIKVEDSIIPAGIYQVMVLEVTAERIEALNDIQFKIVF